MPNEKRSKKTQHQIVREQNVSSFIISIYICTLNLNYIFTHFCCFLFSQNVQGSTSTFKRWLARSFCLRVEDDDAVSTRVDRKRTATTQSSNNNSNNGATKKATKYISYTKFIRRLRSSDPAIQFERPPDSDVDLRVYLASKHVHDELRQTFQSKIDKKRT